MTFQNKIKKGLKMLLRTPEIKVVSQIVTLAPNELLKGRTALITGGTSGIGLEIAKAYVKAGAFVVVTGRDEDKLKFSCDSINKLSNNSCVGIQMDNMKVVEFEDKINTILQIIGNRKIDILVNNAGILTYDTVATENIGQYDRVLDTNLKAPFFLSRIVSRYMIENGIHGNILNIASSSSLRPAISAYTLSKWGLRGFTSGLAKMLAPYHITVNGLAPGQTLTPMVKNKMEKENISHDNVPLGRFILPEEIANMAVVLVSGMGKAILGDIVYMTGGAGNLTFEDVSYKL